MSIFTKHHPGAVFLANYTPCDKCAYPCEAKENSSLANCVRHMEKIINDGKVRIYVEWLEQNKDVKA